MTIKIRRKINFNLQYLFLILLLQIFQVPAVAQNIDVQTSVDKRVIEIGEQFKLTIQINYSEHVNFQYPLQRNNALPNFEIIEAGGIDTAIYKSRKTMLKQSITLTAYDSGIQIIPAIRIPYHNGQSYDTATSSSISIKVVGIPIDFNEDIKDIYPPVETPFNWREILPYLFYIISFIVLTGLGIFSWLYFKKQNSKQETPIETPSEQPAHIDALHQLKQLEKENLIQKKQIMEFHSRLTEHVRRYIEKRFSIKVMEKTSDEILTYVKENKVDKDSFRALEQILVLGDLVKFAKVKPSDKENEKSLYNAYDFINNTKEKANAESQP